VKSSPPTVSPWLHRGAVALSCATLFLIFVGGLVTSTDSGLAVPDWPLSYGRLMPPMVGGILYEHGHRMVAAAVGFLTVVMAIFFSRKEPRLWVRRAAWAAVGLVVLQGVLGGVTVLLRLPKVVSISHACLAQSFLCLVVALAVWTSPRWTAAARRSDPPKALALHVIGLLLFVALYIQLFLGALLRHTGWGLPLHIGGAGAALLLQIWFFARVRRNHNDSGGLRLASTVGLAGVGVQIGLGIGSYWLLVHEFDVIPDPLYVPFLITAHVALGAFLLALSVVQALSAYRTRSSTESPLPRIADYVALTKPGISFMAGITALAGFILGSRGSLDADRLVHTVIGTFLVSAGACALNMLLERDVDSRMHRTENRPLPAGRLQPGEALLFGSLLSVAGILYLAWAVNLLTSFLSGVTLSVYLYLYTPLKKVTSLCTAVGAVAGALPPVMGWTAATGRLGPEAWTLFAILFFWQFPHFLALAWIYREDYARAGLPMLPVVEPDGESTARKAAHNSFALLVVSLLPTFLGLSGRAYFAVALVLGGIFTIACLFFYMERSLSRARRVFAASLLYIPLLFAAMLMNRPSVG
jgi:heme o synthase